MRYRYVILLWILTVLGIYLWASGQFIQQLVGG